MIITEKIKAIVNKIQQNKVHCNLGTQTAKTSAITSGHICKYDFLTGKVVLPENDLLEKAATIKRYEYSLLGKEFKPRLLLQKKDYKDQMKINNNGEDDIEKEDIEVDNVDHPYIGDEYKDLIDDIFKVRLRDGDLCLTEFDNWKLGLTNIVNNYLVKKDIDRDYRLFNFKKPFKIVRRWQ